MIHHKRILAVMAAFLILNIITVAQNIVYLSSLKPVATHACNFAADMPYNSEIKASGVISLGGVNYKTGFALFTTYGPTKPGFVEFSLKGKYSKLMFILGGSPYWATGSKESGVPKGILSVTADGKTILDKAVSQHEVPERITLDVRGVDKLRFSLVTDDVTVGIAEPTLWTASQTPRETGKLSLAQGKPTQLVSSLRPYHVDNYHKCVSSRDGDKHEVKISGKSYSSGLVMNTDIRLIGNGQARSVFNLGGKFKTLRFTAGPVDSDSGTLGWAWLTVKSDGKIIYEYEIAENSVAKQISLDVAGCRQLSIESEQAEGSSSIAVADMMAYPAGMEPAQTVATETLASNDDLKKLPDVCALISNIPPYAVGGSSADRSKTVFDGKSDYITFSMGGVKFKEGVILSSSSNIVNDNTGAHAYFNLGGEFDYVSFTAGWLSKCGVLKNDVLRVYADDVVALEVPLVATSPNQEYTVALNKCQRLGFVKNGTSSLSHPVFAIADIVVYRGKPVENNIFVHPVPDLPEEIDLLDLGNPYIHYVFPMRDYMDRTLYDGSTRKRYLELGNERIYKGFLLQTSVHFDLEAGPLGEKGGGTAVAAGTLGSSIMIGTVGGAAISAVSPFGALIALAAGGTAKESSCAAFNTYGAYDLLTFTVARFAQGVSAPKQKERLLIGGDSKVLQEIELAADMQPTTFTVPINRSKQLMFWINCGDNTSAQYLFYDLKLSRSGTQAGVAVGNSIAD